MKITKKAFHLLRSQLVVNVGGRWYLKNSQRKQTGKGSCEGESSHRKENMIMYF